MKTSVIILAIIILTACFYLSYLFLNAPRIRPKLIYFPDKEISDNSVSDKLEKHILYQDPQLDLVFVFSKVASISPEAQENDTCLPEELPQPPECNDQGLNGKLLGKPRKIFAVYYISFEIDTLEIVLREQFDVVDKFFIVEANFTHKGRPKPMLWKLLRDTKRFQFLPRNKTQQIPVEMDNSKSSDMWFYEVNTEKIATQIIRKQVNSTNEIGDSDVIIFADIDEMVSRETINLLRYCELRHGVLSGAITMPMGNFNLAFRTDFPVENRPHSMGRTTIVQWKLIRTGQHPGGRGHVEKMFVTGGAHLTAHSYVVTTLLKKLTCTECSGTADIPFLQNLTLPQINQYQIDTYNHVDRMGWLSRLDNVDTITDMPKYIPWYLECNPQKFPYWFGTLDSRNRFLESTLEKYFKKLENISHF